MTAVEWLIQQICGEHTDAWNKEIQKAKELEKQQHGQSYKQGYIDATIKVVNRINNLDADDFLEKKDIWNHPYIENRVGEAFELRDLLNEFKDSFNA